MQVPVKRLKIFRDRNTGHVVVMRPDRWYAVYTAEDWGREYDRNSTLKYNAENRTLPPHNMVHFPVVDRIYMQF